MSNKKILKEEEVQNDSSNRQQLMGLVVAVEESALKLYKFAVTDEKVDPSLISTVNKFKAHVTDFVNIINKRESQEEAAEQEKIDLNQPSVENKKDFIESEELQDEGSDEGSGDMLTENKKLNLKESKIWKVSIDVSDDAKIFVETYSKNGFKSKKTKNCLNKLSESFKSHLNVIKENLGNKESAIFEEHVDDMASSENENEFESNYSKLTEWANKEQKLFINLD